MTMVKIRSISDSKANHLSQISRILTMGIKTRIIIDHSTSITITVMAIKGITIKAIRGIIIIKVTPTQGLKMGTTSSITDNKGRIMGIMTTRMAIISKMEAIK